MIIIEVQTNQVKKQLHVEFCCGK